MNHIQIKLKHALTFVTLGLPLMAFAKTNTLKDLAVVIVGYFNIALELMMGLAVVMFVWYVIKYFIQPNDKRKEAGAYVMWALVGFFVILSMWGLVNIVIATFDFGRNSPGSWANISNIFPN